ncbi:MAG: undecaprenyldiphospho-muramoylpentapeptide beta-N-acetylglucosaminyltransferase [Chloroflexota bacterium]|nr:MAG: undecaprenyldiphospho-muramoylpentapeptide beta-N-acetylglucosaminyltransferase [Chloroflexota bacterium]TMD87233.1 MAG: undecaprenyldiphospho-muramoylpentapeptide beta-N-acetylglucosaminyltransferase [Chloroflexota bacterium]
MRVLISGGGTGGHLFPAIAVAQALSRNAPDTQILYVGRRGGMEEQVVPRYGIPLQTIVAAKLDMEKLWRNWSFPLVAPQALLQSARIVRRFRPDVVLGTGGYVSAPVVLASAMARVPVVLQEQNAMPGRATRLLSYVARVVATAYPESAPHLHAKAVVTGTPVRSEFWKRRGDFPTRPQRLLILGGSQGAHRINEAVATAVPELTGRLGLDVWHQTGERDLRWLESLGSSSGGRYHPFAFADDLAEKVYAADLVLSRAGAGSISEVSAAGIPMLLVPGPFAGGHQRLNAEPFERAGAARVIANEECDGPRLTREIAGIADDPAGYSKMVIAMRGLGRPRAAEEVADLLQAAASS